MSKSTPAPPSYEQARDELTDVVRRLEAGGATLEESLALWERGEALATICQELLDGARARLDAARLGSTASGPDVSDEANHPDEPADADEPDE
jgi:exodeoxyribonuclease VII small subunit